MPRTSTSQREYVGAWDLPTRLFHWTLVACIASAWVSFRYAEAFGDHLLKWHRWNGYAILILLIWRVIWGFAGSSTSRFASFLTWPWTAARYGLDLLRGRDRHFLGHNPLGTYMILALLAVVGTQGVLGLFTVEHNDSGAYGPLYRIVSEATYKKLSHWHLWAFYWLLLPLVALHVTANVLYGVIKKDPLIRAMVTGRKPAGAYEDGATISPVDRPLLRAALCLVMAIVVFFGGIIVLGGKLI
jgi:cytochrome b